MQSITIQSKSKKNIDILFQLAKQLGDKPIIEKSVSRAESEFAKSLNSVQLIKSGKLKPNKLSDLLNGKI